jgi:hypothetical protein
LIEKINYLETKTEKYPMAFTLNVMEALQEKYGNLNEWTNLAQKSEEPDIKSLKFFMTEAINEGIEIENDLRLRAAGGRKSGNANRKNQGAMRSAASEQGDYDFDRKIHMEPVTSKQVGRILTEVGFSNLTEKIEAVVSGSVQIDGTSKNALPTKNQTKM